MYPKVIVTVDKDFDKEIILYFIDEKIGDFDFGYDRIIREHPLLGVCQNKSENERMDIIYPYVETYYQNHETDIVHAQKNMQAIWDDISVDYFKQLEILFGELGFYKEKSLIAFLSIAKCGVIGDDYNNFQIWYQAVQEPTEVRRHFAHEILHFYYYTYIKEKKYLKLIDSWDLAEIFNVVILGLPEWVALLGKADAGYKQHEQFFPYYRNLWQESGSLDEYLSKTNSDGLIKIANKRKPFCCNGK
ncbi:MAG: hypothetical protein UR60_C0002G0006 [Candidatus Moranbacteria bacterium GW2011_GWF2_34_56]|nr:MAG: hypothetical protein UR51_C0009G0055 [Candidatus Moranbacteria bacterium GW2011_GWF1_34_10]KKP65354.1 MAG: hypothetical protein UR60_C0002G0006 [Candidatus Moranbacteria bacterium GW2011_GWF2_34_56]HBI17454.1 hypothetical protein [Candidatus Moranbacteria bacterium]